MRARRNRRGAAPSSWTSEALLRCGNLLCVYHRHRLRGVQHLQAALRAKRPVIVVGNHCMDAADPLMLRAALHEATGRLVRFIGHEALFFGLRSLGRVAAAGGIIPSRHPRLAEQVLREDGILALYPGAGTEAALRSYRREPYRLKWYERLGFVEPAIRERAAILFVAGVGIDEMYYQTDVRVPPALFRPVDGTYLESYRGMRVQLGSAGLHLLPGVFPLPVKVTHTISAPLAFDRSVDPSDRVRLEKTQIAIWAKCQNLLDEAVAARERDSDWLDRVLRGGERALQAIGV